MTGVANGTLLLNNRLWVEALPTSYYVIINQLMGDINSQALDNFNPPHGGRWTHQTVPMFTLTYSTCFSEAMLIGVVARIKSSKATLYCL